MINIMLTSNLEHQVCVFLFTWFEFSAKHGTPSIPGACVSACLPVSFFFFFCFCFAFTVKPYLFELCNNNDHGDNIVCIFYKK